MTDISVQINTDQLRSLQANLATIEGAGRLVTYRAVNKTLAGVRTDAVQEIYNILNLTKTRIRKDFNISKATWDGSGGRVYATGIPVGLASFGARQTLKGVSIQVLRSSKRTLLKHAFIATQSRNDGTTYKNVYWRSWDGARTQRVKGRSYTGKYRYSKQFPLERKEGPRIEDIFARKTVMAAVEKKADARLSKNIDYELTRFLKTL